MNSYIDINSYPNLKRVNFKCDHKYEIKWAMEFISSKIKPDRLKKLVITF